MSISPTQHSILALSTQAPSKFSFSPDEKKISFLDCVEGTKHVLNGIDMHTGELSLLAGPPGTGDTEENLSLEEKLRRERTRTVHTGVTSYLWSKADVPWLLIPIEGSLYIKEVNAPLRVLYEKSTFGGAIDPQISPNGEMVAFVSDAEIYIVDVASGMTEQLTGCARGTGRTNGLANYIAQEEMDRYHGFWWSPDSQFIAFEHVDETHIPQYRILHQGKDAVGKDAQEDHHYPFAGENNPR